jgi:hypothetical protein
MLYAFFLKRKINIMLLLISLPALEKNKYNFLLAP